MISNLLFSSLNEFFDRVPLGRIFNRLSKDLSSLDSQISTFFINTLVFAFFILSNVIVIIVISPVYIFLPVVVLYLVFSWFLKMYAEKPIS